MSRKIKKQLPMVIKKNAMQSPYMTKQNIFGALLGGALMFYGYRKRSFLAGVARTIGTAVFGKTLSRIS
jgi:predicted membrane protein